VGALTILAAFRDEVSTSLRATPFSHGLHRLWNTIVTENRVSVPGTIRLTAPQPEHDVAAALELISNRHLLNAISIVQHCFAHGR